MTDFTPNYEIPLPSAEGDLEDDVLVLRQSFTVVDAQLKTNSNAIAQKLGRTATAKNSERLGDKLPEEFATSAQGAKADTAVQPDSLILKKIRTLALAGIAT